ncbi:MFS transporter [Bradyrhizobium huanghuaihaiense]|uniref:MFS transporter n=1 Tax=Bradyrhizobium huanghuaihaiense TaxID=990078 RepID=UPI0021A9F56E|nr:MFS transporter [Bradyrhizobium sp. CB3035]UWU75904.1 MFS transporter [Bradyrhizobium sp. CB3035]
MPPASLPAAVALNGISYNIARSFGPAIGGIVVAMAGAVAAFALKRMVLPATADRTIPRSVSPSHRGCRANNWVTPLSQACAILPTRRRSKIVLTRTCLTGVIGGSISALMPLIAREYRVSQENARAFHNVMRDVQLLRQRNGAYGWSIARDIADPELWTERYHCPTWLDYLHQRNRSTKSERALDRRAAAFHAGPDPVRVRRMLERPFGSVRWKEDVPDYAASEIRPDNG